MESLACDCIVKAYVPFPEHRAECPKVLVIVKGIHHHPIRLPEKTPRAIKAEIIKLLPRFQEDLPDLTLRRFLRNPIVKSYLSIKFPDVLNPMLSNLHISLANRSHLKAYIDQVREAIFPHGTDWKGSHSVFYFLSSLRSLIARSLTPKSKTSTATFPKRQTV
jgi:hypothetical protein